MLFRSPVIEGEHQVVKSLLQIAKRPPVDKLSNFAQLRRFGGVMRIDDQQKSLLHRRTRTRDAENALRLVIFLATQHQRRAEIVEMFDHLADLENELRLLANAL